MIENVSESESQIFQGTILVSIIFVQEAVGK